MSAGHSLFEGRKWILAALLAIILSIPACFFILPDSPGIILLFSLGIITCIAAILSVEKLLIFTVFAVPLSIQLRFIVPEVGADLFLPTEPVLAVIMLVVIFKIIHGGEIDRRILYHPVTISAAVLLLWIFICALTGTMPVVSLKYLVTRIWFITGFYILAAQVFMKKERINQYFSAYLAGMTPVAIYYLVRLSMYGVLNQETAYSAIRPFFNDHTALGASLAFSIPAAVFLLLRGGERPFLRITRFAQLILLIIAFTYSYSRAAWISLAAAGIVALVLWLRISWKIIVAVSVTACIIAVVSWSSLFIRLNENRQDSSLDFRKQVVSITNIKTDASNLERLNRWNSAIRMAAERPVFGWGPGTYQFTYAPFQLSYEKTRISTIWGERGNAHSEYLGLMSETGVPGMIIYIVLLGFILRSGISQLKKADGREARLMYLCLVAGLTTYIIHGGLNNFLDTDKISAMFWGMTAVIVANDTAGKSLQEDDQNSSAAMIETSSNSPGL